MRDKILFIMGTRPEIIKLYPIIQEFKNRDLGRYIKICFTGQHSEMARGLLKYFNISPDYDLNIMEPQQSLNRMTGKLFMQLDDIFQECSPDWIVAQGDTTSVWTSAVAAFHNRTRFAHVEAGLRSRDKANPFPEEINRVLTSCVADLHFAPTEAAKQNLLNEGVADSAIKIVGNTVIDSLQLTLKKWPGNNHHLNFIEESKKLILVTLHRRENHGKPIEEICHALLDIANKHENIQIVFPVHLNPDVRKVVFPVLDNSHARRSGVFVIDPPDYEPFVYLLDTSWLIITDSGGIQEEAPTLNKPVLILRDVTERPECVEIGAAKLIGNSAESLIENVDMLIRSNSAHKAMCNKKNPFGDGKAAVRIVDHLLNYHTHMRPHLSLVRNWDHSPRHLPSSKSKSLIPEAGAILTA